MRELFSFVLMHPILTLGSPAPDFALPGVDGKVHTLKDYAAKRVVVVVFTCNHCPIAQMYERRIEQLYEDYSKRSVAIVAIHDAAWTGWQSPVQHTWFSRLARTAAEDSGCTALRLYRIQSILDDKIASSET
jgi:thiol-disulfide isomerase/thioredoxin